ncbi:SAM-dependent methyltransferase [Candidatus Geothermarchaeota archaeon]|nr:MAG: SAM-dependent methyltransferase [Candidatus Geothermarchaeota archaeon]
MRRYSFKPKICPLITSWVAKRIIAAQKAGFKKIKVTLDLGLTSSLIKITQGRALLNNESVDVNLLEKVVGDNIYLVLKGKLMKVSMFSNGKFYKLKAVGEKTAPTVEISGIHMHRVRGVTPWMDSQMKVLAVRISRGNKVLDVCTGLGYTAIISLKRGASEVITIEKDENVLKIAELNPWSRLLANERIKIIHGDANEVVREFEEGSFDRIIHDPPRFSLAGELYSLDFYKELYRILKPNGLLFHYTGTPGEKFRRRDIFKEVSSRLTKAGFIVIKKRKLRGLLAKKV